MTRFIRRFLTILFAGFTVRNDKFFGKVHRSLRGTALPHSVGILVPSTVGSVAMSDEEHAAAVLDVANSMSNLFGAATANGKGFGMWEGITEGITLVWSAVADLSEEELVRFKILCETVQVQYAQQTLGIMVDGKLIVWDVKEYHAILRWELKSMRQDVDNLLKMIQSW